MDRRPKQDANYMEDKRLEKRAQIIGWGLFVLCALFFLGSSIVNQDAFAFLGSLVFLLACVVFLVPLLRVTPIKQKQDKTP